MSEKRKLIAISGGFDPVHVGHVQMIEEAAMLGDVMVIVNSDDWLVRKKGYIFMPWAEKAYIMGQFKGVVKVVSVDDSDGSVCEALRTHRPDAFANGGDRKHTNTPEMDVCEELGIELLWNIGGEKIQSSSDLVNRVKWGKMVINGVEI
jgi:D-beta-D-heptose 7-phosphate kinase/D-beta-D-heptose 1-phosphate adenosyltransferase